MVECGICTDDVLLPAPPHKNCNGVPCAAHFCCECLLKALQYDSRCPTCRVHLAHPVHSYSSYSSGFTSDEEEGDIIGPSYNWDWDEEEGELEEMEEEWVGYLCSTLFCPEEERRLREEEEEREGYDASILFTDMYEGVLEYCQALACLEGYKILNHLCITDFLKELGLQDIAVKFDRHRKLRNSVNYYGKALDPDFSLRSISEMQAAIKRLKQFISENHNI